MEINDLREMLILAEKRSYAAAADALFISTSSLSRHIAAMEHQLGVPLFYRNSRSVLLTRYGEILLPYARRIADLEDEYREELDKVKRSDGAGLRIGTFFGLSALGVMSQVAKFLGANQEIALALQNAPNDQLLDMLRKGKYDLAFVQEDGPSPQDEFGRLTVALDSLSVALPADHVLAGAPSVRLSQLRDELFLPEAYQSMQHRLAMEAFRCAGYTPKQAQLATLGIGVLELVEQRLGIALVQTKIAQEKHRPDISLVPLDPPTRIWVNLVWCPDRLLETSKSFIAHFRDSAAGHPAQK